MARPEDDLQRMRDGKRVGWRFAKLERILLHYGFRLVNQRGSDRVYKHEPSGVRYFVSHHGAGPVKPGYIKKFVAQLDLTTP